MCPVVHITGAADFLTQFEYHELDTYCAQTDRNTVWTEGDLPNYLGNAPDSLVVNTEGERFTNEQNVGFNGWMSGPTFYTLYSDAQIKEEQERFFVHREVVLTAEVHPKAVHDLQAPYCPPAVDKVLQIQMAPEPVDRPKVECLFAIGDCVILDLVLNGPAPIFFSFIQQSFR